MTDLRESPSSDPASKPIALQIGALTPEQIAMIFTHLPVDVTFVDEGNDVRFYSGGKNRIFERTPDVIGRNVLNCHSPDSVQIVYKILEDFRAGTRDTAEFWLKGFTKTYGLLSAGWVFNLISVSLAEFIFSIMFFCWAKDKLPIKKTIRIRKTLRNCNFDFIITKFSE